MKQVAVILLQTFLRRYPLPTRLSLFSYLGRYAWLKDVLEELRPVLFPPRRDPSEPVATQPVSPELDSSVLSILERAEICGRLGYYKAETYLGARGRGHLFGAIEATSKRPVVIKEFLLPALNFAKTEARQRQNRFQQLAGLQLTDGRRQDFRVIQPLEAIADSESQERCFLITDIRDRYPTLRQHLHQRGALPLQQVREVLSQILQTLDFLHRQKFSFPAGATQNGLVHGNLSLDSILWAEQQAQPFVYLCDLRLWEQCFDASLKEWRSTQVTAETLQQDLSAAGEIGVALLQGLNSSQPVVIEPAMQLLLDSLGAARFDSAETARRELLRLAPRSPTVITPLAEGAAQTQARQRFPLLILSLLGLAIGAFVLFPRLRSPVARSAPTPKVSTCCLAEVSAMPAGNYLYTAVRQGTWWTVLQQQNLLQRGQSLTSALQVAQPKLQLRYTPAPSIAQVFTQVRSGAADFAVLPQIDELPEDMLAQEIAYDGLALVVSFSYAERQQGLPTALNGKLTLEQVQQLFTEPIADWKAFSGKSLAVQRYTSSNPEAIALFEQRVLQSRKLPTLSGVTQVASLDLLRRVIRDFEEENTGSIGLTPMSEIWGQCSVYPLALSQTG